MASTSLARLPVRVALPPPPPPAPPPKQPTLGNILGFVAIAVGVGVLGAYVFDLHGHRCQACGHKWRHLGALNLGDPGAHTCTQCGTVQWWKDGVPHVFRSAIQPETSPGPTQTRLQQLARAAVGSRSG